MAGSRRESVGTILTRMRGLLKSGAVKYEERPLWYDVVTAKPPKPIPPARPVQKILYPEDFVRVQFYKVYADPHPIQLSNETRSSVAQRFISKYLELREQTTDSTVNLFEETARQLQQNEGVHLLTHEEKRAFREKRLKPKEAYASEPDQSSMPSTDSMIDSLFEQEDKK